MKKIIFLLLVGLIVSSCGKKEATQQGKQKREEGIRVKIEMAEKQAVDHILNFTGLTEPSLTVPLSFQLPATVQNIFVEVGDQVSKGKVLAELNKTTYQSSYNAALSMQKQAQDAYNRLKTVYDKGSLPEIKWEEMKSKLEQANAAEQIAKQNLENCKIISPINGLIGTRNIEVGENTTPGVTAFKVISINTVYARVSVPENEINKIIKGQLAAITLPAIGEKIFDGTVEKISLIANAISKTYEVKLKIDNEDLEIKPGMVCNLNLPLEEMESSLLVPIQSVMKDAHGARYVFVVDKATKKVNKRNVKISGIANNKICITSGLKHGEWLVVEGQQKLTDNTSVSFN